MTGVSQSQTGRKEDTHIDIAFDGHKGYTYVVVEVEDEDGRVLQEARILHGPGAMGAFLSRCEPGYPVTVGAVGRHLAEATYWILERVSLTEIKVLCREVRGVSATDTWVQGGPVNSSWEKPYATGTAKRYVPLEQTKGYAD